MSDGFDAAAKRAAGEEKLGLSRGLTRRRVVQGAAWSVPVIAIAAPVPAFAGASQGSLTLDGTGCKLPGNSNSSYKGYAFNLNAKNTTALKKCILITSVTLNSQDLGSVTVLNLAGSGANACVPLGNPICLAPGETLNELALLTTNAANSSNGILEVTYKEAVGSGSSTCSCTGAQYGPALKASTTINGAPPINGSSCTAFTRQQKRNCLAVATPPPAWQASTAYAVGDTVRLTGGEILTATVAGTSGTTEPAPPGQGNSVVDGQVTWEQA